MSSGYVEWEKAFLATCHPDLWSRRWCQPVNLDRAGGVKGQDEWKVSSRVPDGNDQSSRGTSLHGHQNSTRWWPGSTLQVLPKWKRSSKNQGHQEVIGGHGWTYTAMDRLISVRWCVFSDIVDSYILDNEMQVWWTLVKWTGKVNVISTNYF